MPRLLLLACREWHGISEIYLNLTRSVGRLHHFAWKANSSEVRRPSRSADGSHGLRCEGLLSCTVWLCALPTCTRVLRAPLGRLDRDPTSVAPPQPADPHPPSPTALRLQWVMYLEKEDAKYSHWTAEECSSRWAGGTGPAAGRAAVHAVPCWQAA